MSGPATERPDFLVEQEDDAVAAPTRLAVVQEQASPLVDVHDEPMVMTFPHLLVRELITIIAVTLACVVLALLFAAPLEELANPLQTPNPSKAPWYFLGLQELLHYYPPFVAGVLIPGVVVAALVVIPYFNVNLERVPFWETARRTKLAAVAGTIVALNLLLYFLAKHPVWPLIGTTIAVSIPMLLPALANASSGPIRWLATRSLAFWVFTWFVVANVVLTIIGVYFRGPGWAFTLPWVHGVY